MTYPYQDWFMRGDLLTLVAGSCVYLNTWELVGPWVAIFYCDRKRTVVYMVHVDR
jgi:hypothetical protein